MKLRSFCSAKDMVNKTKWQPTEWEKVFTNPTLDRGLISKYTKNSRNLSFFSYIQLRTVPSFSTLFFPAFCVLFIELTCSNYCLLLSTKYLQNYLKSHMHKTELTNQVWRCISVIQALRVMSSRPVSATYEGPCLEKKYRAAKIAHWVKALTANPDKLISVPKTHMVEGENQLLQIIWSLSK